MSTGDRSVRKMDLSHGGFLKKIGGKLKFSKNESRHLTQLNETSKTRYILYKDTNDSHGRVVSVSGFAFIALGFESCGKLQIL